MGIGEMFGFNDGPELRQSKFDSGIAVLMRIDLLKRNLYMARANHLHEQVFLCIRDMYLEVMPFLDKEEDEEIEELDSEIENLLSVGDDSDFDNWSLHNKLFKFEKKVSSMIHKYGLGMPKRATGMDAARG